MTGIFGILESSATQWYQDVTPTQEFFFHCHIYSLWSYPKTLLKLENVNVTAHRGDISWFRCCPQRLKLIANKGRVTRCRLRHLKALWRGHIPYLSSPRKRFTLYALSACIRVWTKSNAVCLKLNWNVIPPRFVRAQTKVYDTEK